jgi:hypothetical protein
MSYPQNPETLVIQNKYYPKGLKEIDIWNYYQSIKNLLLKETLGKSLIVFFATDLNKFIVMRKNKTNGLIRLTPSLYDTVVSGRTISFNNVMNKTSNYGVVDIDTDNFKKAKDLVLELYDIFNKEKYVNNIKIIYTAKDSFHLRIFFGAEYKIDYIKYKLEKTLTTSNLKYAVTVKSKRTKNIPNLDLQRNIYNAGHIALGSLSTDGLKCVEVSIKKLMNFRKEDAKI